MSEHEVFQNERDIDASSTDNFTDEDDHLEPLDIMNNVQDKSRKSKQSRTVSKYRRENLKYLRGLPKKVYFQVMIMNDNYVEKSSVFEINVDNLSCQRLYLDEQRQNYIICQIITKHGAKHLIIRSPMQITNNLQIKLEIELISSIKKQ